MTRKEKENCNPVGSYIQIIQLWFYYSAGIKDVKTAFPRGIVKDHRYNHSYVIVFIHMNKQSGPTSRSRNTTQFQCKKFISMKAKCTTNQKLG